MNLSGYTTKIVNQSHFDKLLKILLPFLISKSILVCIGGNMNVQCIKQSNLAITLCKFYQILNQDTNVRKVQIYDDNGSVVWVDADCFRI